MNRNIKTDAADTAIAVCAELKIKNGKMAGNFIGAPTKAVATGYASWCRCYDRKGNAVVDGTAGDGEDFFCYLTSSYIELGGTVLIKSMIYHV